MAIDLRFNCDTNALDYLKVISDTESKIISIHGMHEGKPIEYDLDVSTAIKLSKTIRTHINKVKGI